VRRFVRAIYNDVVAFRQATDVPNNVRLAVRRFESVYRRGLGQREDRIIDELIALEALAGSGTELRFRLAFRISSLLASDDDERLALFDAMKRYYDLRSKIVHGSSLKPDERAFVNDDAELRDIVRRVVRAVIYATAHTNIRLTGKYIDEQLIARFWTPKHDMTCAERTVSNEPRRREQHRPASVAERPLARQCASMQFHTS
jgi:hypothetical protein